MAFATGAPWQLEDYYPVLGVAEEGVSLCPAGRHRTNLCEPGFVQNEAWDAGSMPGLSAWHLPLPPWRPSFPQLAL